MSLYEKKEKEDVHTHKAAAPGPSCVSMKSHTSMDYPVQFSNRAVIPEPE